MRKLLIFAVAACGAYAFAATEGTTGTVKSEYFYQTDADKNDATPALGYTSSTTKPKGTGATDEETTQTILNVTYERGINEMISAGGSIGYVNGKTDMMVNDADNNGLDDIRLFVKGNNSFVPSQSLNYGATLNYSIGKKKFETDAVSVNSGGTAITPYVGYQFLMGNQVIGTRLQTAMELQKAKWEDSATTPGTTTELDAKGLNRTILTGFYETMAGGGTWGGEIGWWGDSTLELESPAGTQEIPGEVGYSVAAYSKFDVTEGAQIVGKLSWENALSDHNNIDSASKFGLNIGGRFTF